MCFVYVFFLYRNELLGLEGMVKIKNPDDNVTNSNSVVSIDPKASIGDADTKRCCFILCLFIYLFLC